MRRKDFILSFSLWYQSRRDPLHASSSARFLRFLIFFLIVVVLKSFFHEAMTTNETVQSSANQSSETSALNPAANSSNTSVSLLNNIFNLVSVRLDSTNYVLWRFQISPLLKSHKLFKYVDGSIKAPEAIIRTEGQPPSINPDHEIWYERDQALITLINATLTQTALSYVIGCQTSKDIWDTLEKHFSSSTRTNIIGLKSELQSVSKQSGERAQINLI